LTFIAWVPIPLCRRTSNPLTIAGTSPCRGNCRVRV
jgi:hypothetical protein